MYSKQIHKDEKPEPPPKKAPPESCDSPEALLRRCIEKSGTTDPFAKIGDKKTAVEQLSGAASAECAKERWGFVKCIKGWYW